MSINQEHSYNKVKFDHLMRQNSILVENVRDLEEQLLAVRKLNRQLLEKDEKSLNSIVFQLTERNSKLENQLQRLIQSNQDYLCEILMKEQLICQIQRQHDQIINNYEQKIVELRASLLKKQDHINKLQAKNSKQSLRIAPPTIYNLSYLNEINNMKMYLDKLNLENSQLKYLIQLKENELARLQKKIKGYELTFKKLSLLELQDLSYNMHSSTLMQQQKISDRIKIQQEIAKYDSTYQEILFKKCFGQTIQSLKLIATHLNNQNIMLLRDKMSLLSSQKIWQNDKRLMQKAYKQMQRAIQSKSAEIELLKIHVKNLRNERKRCQHLVQGQVNNEENREQRQVLLSYWKKCAVDKDWQKLTHKCILSVNSRNLSQKIKRSVSCPAYFDSSKLHLEDKHKSNGKLGSVQNFSALIESCKPALFIEQDVSNRKYGQSSLFFDEDISMIKKSIPNKMKNDYDGDLRQIDLQQ